MTESANRPGAVESEILLLQWMVGLVIALQLLTVGAVLILLWRLMPLTK